jgi:hypothetical protein
MTSNIGYWSLVIGGTTKDKTMSSLFTLSQKSQGYLWKALS